MHTSAHYVCLCSACSHLSSVHVNCAQIATELKVASVSMGQRFTDVRTEAGEDNVKTEAGEEQPDQGAT